MNSYLDYLDQVIHYTNRKGLFLACANAVSPMWCRKSIVRGSQSFDRGVVLEEWLMLLCAE